MKRLLVYFMLTSPAYACHHYRTWHYPYPQRCYSALAHIPKLDKPIHIPVTLPPERLPIESEDLYPPEAIYKLQQALEALHPH